VSNLLTKNERERNFNSPNFSINLHQKSLLILTELDSQTALSTVLPVLVVAQKDAGAAGFLWAFFSFPLQFSYVINLVELQGGELHLGSGVLDLFWGGVDLLLSFSATTEYWVNDFEG